MSPRAFVSLLVMALFIMVFLFAVAQPTPDERARMLDSTGRTTGVNWR